MVAQYNLYVDWSNNGSFADAGEDVSARTFSSNVRWERGRDQARQLAPPMAGAFVATLDNSSGDYSPENTGSPLAGNVEPGRALKLEAVSGGTVALWRGHLDEPTQESAARTVGLRALGKLAKLKGTTITTAYYANIATSTAFGYVCAAAGLAAAEYTALDTGKTILTSWWCYEDNAFAMLTRILAAEGPGAAIYERADGVIAFHSRHYRLLTARATTSQATIRDTGADPLHVPPFRYDRGHDGVVNSATIAVLTLTRDVSPTANAWTWAGSLVLPFGQAMTWTFDLPYPADTLTPVVTATNKRDYVESYTPAAGRRFSYTYSNENADGTAQVVTGVTVSAHYYRSAKEPVSNGVSTGASRAKYGLRSLPSSYDPWPCIAPAVARDFCDAIVQAYQDPRPTVAITVENATATDLAQVLNREISDRITIVDANSYLNHEFFVERLAHEVGEAGGRHRLTLGCEKAGSINYAIWGTSTWGGAVWGF